MLSSVLFERDTESFTIRLVRYQANSRMPMHCHDEHGVSVVLDGALVEEAQHRSVAVEPGWTVVKPAGTYHANRFGPVPTTLLGLTLRRPLDESSAFQWHWLDRPATYQMALRLFRAVIKGEVSDRENALAEFAATLSEETPSAKERTWLRAVRRTIDELNPSAASVADLAATAGVHPVYLARRFRGAFGVSVREYRQIAQVRRATQLVLRTDRSLSEIAHACGFSDHSHMCRSFRIVAGLNPAALRAS